jgi:hypothetical protein
MEKKCTVCGDLFHYKPSNLKAKYCSNKCRFKGYTPANKGTKRTPEQVEFLRRFSIGRTPWNKGKKRPEMTGTRHPLWIKDRTKLARYKNGNEYRNSPMSRDWARRIKDRDGWKCQSKNQECSGKVVAHHILSWKEYPELRYQIKNGITLCHAHHPRKRAEEKRLESEFQMTVSVSCV